MVSISCDVCKKKMDNPITDRSFFYFAEHSICEPCRDNLEYQIRTVIRNKEPFSMDWYQKLLYDSLEKSSHKAKA